jgi:predicted flap endonuclease-1-like 5' DNA nuclease
MRPAGLSSPRSGVPDNLQRIRGIGRRNEELLQSLGIFHFGQIAAWTPAEARWIAAHLKFPERIERDDWIGQATILASGAMLPQEKDAQRRADAEDDG